MRQAWRRILRASDSAARLPLQRSLTNRSLELPEDQLAAGFVLIFAGPTLAAERVLARLVRCLPGRQEQLAGDRGVDHRCKYVAIPLDRLLPNQRPSPRRRWQSPAAGGPILAEQYVEGVFPLPRQLLGDGTRFLPKVAGDSVIGAEGPPKEGLSPCYQNVTGG